MNPVASLLTIDGIALNVDAPSRKRAFEELAHLFEKNAGIPHREAFDALNARERLGCISIKIPIISPFLLQLLSCTFSLMPS